LIPAIPKGSPALFISPHLDDVIYSCGATAAAWARSRPVLVATVFAGTPPEDTNSRLVAHFHRLWGTASRPTLRLQEDVRAAEVVGSMPVHLNFIDGIYRTDERRRPRYTSVQSIFDADPGCEASLEAEVVEGLRGLIRSMHPAVIVAPLAIGGHIDHILTRRACDALTGTHAHGRDRVWYYEDLPYALHRDEQGWVERHCGGLYPSVRFVDGNAWTRKREAVNVYGSQKASVWGEHDAPHELERYARKVGSGRLAERFWRRRSVKE
jgi:LmbE family N-acetylglucosaminyl deacetylase